jgi:hypothetical protein
LYRGIWLTVILSISTAACAPALPYLPAPQTVTAAGTWKHSASGMEFPAELAGFERNAIAHFSAASPDIAVNYRLVTTTGAIDATVYLMPEPSLPTLGLTPEAAATVRDQACRAEFAARVQEITAVDKATVLDTEPVVAAAGGARRTGRLARFAYQAEFAGEQQAVRSELARFCFAGGGWSIEYRFSYPAGFDAAGWIASLVAALPWTGVLAAT